MPIQNIGTLLENIVVAEAAALLSRLKPHPAGPLEFVNAFAMPPRSEWRSHNRNAGFDDDALDALVSTEPPSGSKATYASLLQANLRMQRTLGPSAAMLVLGAWKRRSAVRLWLNDVRQGHYGDCIEGLTEIDRAARAIYHETAERSYFDLSVSASPYPQSLDDLANCLREWRNSSPPAACLAFLDPMRYRLSARGPADTSSDDHRRWLRLLRFGGLTIAVHFTGNSDHPSLARELYAMHEDAQAAGYPKSMCFSREHYAIFVAVDSAEHQANTEILSALEADVQRAWQEWFYRVKGGAVSALRIIRNGLPEK